MVRPEEWWNLEKTLSWVLGVAVAESSTVIHSEHIFVAVVSRVEKVHRSQTYQNRKVARPKSAE